MSRGKALKNIYVKPNDRLDFTRSVFRYEKTHSSNILTGGIYPVAHIWCNPGTTVPNKFGFILQSAPLLGPSLDNIYIDIVSVFCPVRLVMGDFNEWLGDNDTYAWTLGNNVHFPKITDVYTGRDVNGNGLSKAYLAEHCLAPHIGFRYNSGLSSYTDLTTMFPTGSIFHDGVSVIPSRMYDCIYNRIFRNENITNPVLFSKQSGTNLSLDVNNYRMGLGMIRKATRLKNVFNTARISPAIETVDIGLGKDLPVGFIVGATGTTTSSISFGVPSSANLVAGEFHQIESITAGGVSGNAFIKTFADLSALTVNSLYYAIMMQKYLNKASNGRRPVEFYKNFFGITNSNAQYDDPQLLSQKRFKVNVSRVVATANSKDAQNNDQPIGTQGAFSLTSAGGTLFPEFTASEYGMFWVFAVVRTQESLASGIDKYLSYHELLSTYLTAFDHIGEEAIERAEIVSSRYTSGNVEIFGYQRAWYSYRHQINTVVGILSPDETLGYMTLSRDFGTGVSIGNYYIEQSAHEFDRMLQFPVFYGTGTGFDGDGENYGSTRYQWIIQFALAGDLVAVMSPDSEPLMFGL